MIHKLKCMYVINQVKKAKLPTFAEGELKRYGIIFSGKVQNVGFRLEASEMAKRLGLTGWVKNLPDGSVKGEFQGTKERIDFLVEFMSSIKRIQIDRAEHTELDVIPDEKSFSSDHKAP